MPNIEIATIPLASLMAHNCSNSPNYNKANFPKLFTGRTFTDLSLKPVATDSNLRDDSLNPAAPMNISKKSLRSLMPSNWPGKLVNFWQAYLYNGTNHPEAGYHNDDPTVIARQMDDSHSRGFDCVTLDLYGPNFKGAGNDFVMDNIAMNAQRTQQTFYATFDQQCLTAGANQIPPSLYQSALIAYIDHVADRYFGHPAYEHFNGRPLLTFWGFGQTLKNVPLDWLKIKAAIRGNPWIILYQSNGFTIPGSDGALGWLPTSAQPGNPSGSNYLKNYMLPAIAAHQDKIGISSAWARFNGTLTGTVNWSQGKHLDGMGGMTLLETMGLNAEFAKTHKLPYVQLVWDDLQEGDTLINGVENDISLTAKLNGTQLSWTVTGHEQTVSAYDIYAEATETEVYKLGSVAPGQPKVFDLKNALVDFGAQSFYVQAVGQPCIQNRLVKAA
jgi:hypothetical protein